VPTQVEWDAAQAEAEKVRGEIQNGADFAAEAKKYSDDATTKDAGGDLGLVTRGQMVPAFEEAVFSLKKGELSQPVKTQYGYHLIEVSDIVPEKQLSYDEVSENIKSSPSRAQTGRRLADVAHEAGKWAGRGVPQRSQTRATTTSTTAARATTSTTQGK